MDLHKAIPLRFETKQVKKISIKPICSSYTKNAFESQFRSSQINGIIDTSNQQNKVPKKYNNNHENINSSHLQVDSALNQKDQTYIKSNGQKIEKQKRLNNQSNNSIIKTSIQPQKIDSSNSQTEDISKHIEVSDGQLENGNGVFEKNQMKQQIQNMKNYIHRLQQELKVQREHSKLMRNEEMHENLIQLEKREAKMRIHVYQQQLQIITLERKNEVMQARLEDLEAEKKQFERILKEKEVVITQMSRQKNQDNLMKPQLQKNLPSQFNTALVNQLQQYTTLKQDYNKLEEQNINYKQKVQQYTRINQLKEQQQKISKLKYSFEINELKEKLKIIQLQYKNRIKTLQNTVNTLNTKINSYKTEIKQKDLFILTSIKGKCSSSQMEKYVQQCRQKQSQ